MLWHLEVFVNTGPYALYGPGNFKTLYLQFLYPIRTAHYDNLKAALSILSWLREYKHDKVMDVLVILWKVYGNRENTDCNFFW